MTLIPAPGKQRVLPSQTAEFETRLVHKFQDSRVTEKLPQKQNKIKSSDRANTIIYFHGSNLV